MVSTWGKIYVVDRGLLYLQLLSDICRNIYVLVKNAMCEPGKKHSSDLKCFEAT